MVIFALFNQGMTIIKQRKNDYSKILLEYFELKQNAKLKIVLKMRRSLYGAFIQKYV